MDSYEQPNNKYIKFIVFGLVFLIITFIILYIFVFQTKPKTRQVLNKTTTTLLTSDPPSFPQKQYVSLYEECDFKGKNVNLDIGEYNSENMTISDKSLSSIKIPKGYRIQLFNENDFTGDRIMTIEANEMPLEINCLDNFNNITSSIIISLISEAEPKPKHDYVYIYEECQFNGNNNKLKVGSYNTSELGISDKSLSSLKIPPGFNVKLFKSNNYTGDDFLQLTTDSNAPVLIGFDCLSSQFFDNMTSSITISKK